MAQAHSRRWTRWPYAGAVAGIIGGIAMALYLIIACALIGVGSLLPINAIAGISVAFRPVGPAFVPSAFVFGSLLHLMVSAIWGIALAAAIHYRVLRVPASWQRTLAAGLLFGALVWSISGIMIGPGMNPSLLWMPTGHWFISHLIYGVVTTGALSAASRRPRLRVTFLPEGAIPERRPAGVAERDTQRRS